MTFPAKRILLYLFGQQRDIGGAQRPGIDAEILDAAVKWRVRQVAAQEGHLIADLTRGHAVS